jgi:hypothetical protein
MTCDTCITKWRRLKLDAKMCPRVALRNILAVGERATLAAVVRMHRPAQSETVN